MSAILILSRRQTKARATRRILTDALRLARELMVFLFEPPAPSAPMLPPKPYRPERHYMRGPGPKWHAKHGTAWRR